VGAVVVAAPKEKLENLRKEVGVKIKKLNPGKVGKESLK
jgi:hypothetical protein